MKKLLNKKLLLTIIITVVLVGVGYGFYSVKFIPASDEIKNDIESEESTETFFDSIPTIDIKQIQEEIDVGTIVFQNKGNIYVLNTKNMQTRQLPIREAYEDNNEYDKSILKPGKFQLSSDGRYLFFKIIKGKFNEIFKIYVFDIGRERIVKIIDFSDDELAAPYWVRGFSPQNSYINLHFSTGGGASLAIADFESGKIVYEDEGWPVWSPEETKFAKPSREVFINALPFDAYTNSLYIVEIDNKSLFSKYLLLEADKQHDYKILYWKDDNNLIYSMKYYKEPFPEFVKYDHERALYYENVYKNPETTYWKINVNTMEKEELNEINEGLILNSFDTYSIGVKTDDKLKPAQVIYSRDDDRNWKIVRANYGNDAWDIYLVNKDNTKKVKIAEGTDILWIPKWETDPYRNEEYGFEFEFPENWSFYESRKEDTGEDYASVLSFAPVPPGMPWGDSFGGFISIRKNIDDFFEWFDQEARFGAAGTQRMIEFANSQYGEGFLKEEDFKSEYRNTTVRGYPAIVETTEIINCPTGDSACYFLGSPMGYEIEWYIYKDNSVVEIGVQTYEGPVEGLDKIIESFKFI